MDGRQSGWPACPCRACPGRGGAVAIVQPGGQEAERAVHASRLPRTFTPQPPRASYTGNRTAQMHPRQP